MSVEEIARGSPEGVVTRLPLAVRPDVTYSVDGGDIDILIRVLQCDATAATPGFGERVTAIAESPELRAIERDVGSLLVRAYIVAKVADMTSDAQLFGPHKLFDLINKKVLLINNLPKIEGIAVVRREFVYKVLQLLLLLPPDHRLWSIVQFLHQHYQPNPEIEPPQFEATRQLYRLVEAGRLMPLGLFRDFLLTRDALVAFGGLLTAWVQSEDPTVWVCNAMESNLVRLARYYQLIALAKIYAMFELESAAVDLEGLVVAMIGEEKLPPATKLDQRHGVLEFGQPEPAPALNEAVIQVVGMINDISYDIK